MNTKETNITNGFSASEALARVQGFSDEEAWAVPFDNDTEEQARLVKDRIFERILSRISLRD